MESLNYAVGFRAALSLVGVLALFGALLALVWAILNSWWLRAAGPGRDCAPAALDGRFWAAVPQLHR